MSACKRVGLSLGIAACLGLLALTLTRVAERGRFARPFSSYGSGEQGTRALYVLLSELGHPVVRWSQDLAGLPSHATLVALGSCESATARTLSRLESGELLSWLAHGGVLVLAGARNYLPEDLGVAFQDDAACEVLHGAEPAADGGDVDLFSRTPTAAPPEAVWAVPLHAGLEGLPIIPFRAPGKLVIAAHVASDVLLGVPPAPDSDDAELRPLAVMLRYGLGRVIVLSSANMLQNAELEGSEGATLFARLLGTYGNPELLIFDEYHLGLGERRSLMQYLRELGAMPLLCQLLVIAVIVLRRMGARLGEPRAAERSSAAEDSAIPFSVALGALYARVGDGAGALRSIARAALLRVRKQYGLGAMQTAELARSLEQRGATDAARAVEEIIAAARASGAEESLVQSVTRIDRALAAAVGSEESGASASRMAVRGGPRAP